MSPLFTRDEMRDRLRSQDVGEEAIERVLAREFPGAESGQSATHYVHVDFLKRLDFPIRLVLPWSALCSDNDKYGAVIRGTMASYHPRLILTAKYKAAKLATRAKGREAMGSFSPLAMPLALHACVYVPDNRPGHDVANFAKCCHDGLEKTVYVKDEWLHDVRWRRVGVDVDRPRAEIEIRPL